MPAGLRRGPQNRGLPENRLPRHPQPQASAVTASGCQGQRGRPVPPPRRFGEQFQSPVNGLFDRLD